jgi:hypothetical protein
MDNEYKFAALYKKFIDDLLQENNNSDESNGSNELQNLLIRKKAVADRDWSIAKYNLNVYEKGLRRQREHLELMQWISFLPYDIKQMIGAYSQAVRNQKSLIRIEFYINWFMINKARIIALIKGWSKAKLGFVLDKIRSPNNPYCGCCKPGTNEYKKGTTLMFKSRIETLIEEKGKRSNMEMYSLLLAIEKYDKKK